MRFDNPPMPSMRWVLYCRVVDNFGDVGVCWRLARALAADGDAVRLVIDDASALAWMAPHGAPGVTVTAWPGHERDVDGADVVVEAFGCDPPAEAVQAMRCSARPPVWINLEYLSAEPYVERSHGLPSPQRGGLLKWFFYPGFTAGTGGLLREPDLRARQTAFDRAAWLHALGVQPRETEVVVSLFCYPNPALPALLSSLAQQGPACVLVTPGHAARALGALPAGLRAHFLPWLSQEGFDHLLWSCDLNLVRGEDSLVRALWAGAPFLWQAYPQEDGAHHAKVEALLQQAALPGAAASAMRAWNGSQAWPGLPPRAAWGGWRVDVERWCAERSQAEDLATSLRQFARRKQAADISARGQRC
jgi:uncharacterized repeat protein (TIGR03837 family)